MRGVSAAPIILGVSGIVVLSAIITLASFSSFRAVNDISEHVVARQARNVWDAQRLQVELEAKLTEGRGFLLTGDQQELQQLEQTRERFLAISGQLMGRLKDAPSKGALAQVVGLEQEHQAELEKLVPLRLASKREHRATEHWEQQMLPQRAAIADATNRLVGLQLDDLMRADSEAQVAGKRALALILGVGVVAICGTVTICGLLIRALTRSYRALRDAASERIRIRDEFLAIAAHELKTPLTSLKLQLAAFRREPNPAEPAFERRMTLVERQVERLAHLVTNLTEISSLAGGNLSMELEDEVDLGEVARAVIERQSPDCQRACCEVALSVSGKAVGTWDRLRLEQVVTNLLSNACKYGAGKPVQVRVLTEPLEARLEVLDEGIGIAREKQEQIFERFGRAVSERHYGGLGLGLWMVREIVTAMGGRIEVESAPGRGARFSVTLPRSSQPNLPTELIPRRMAWA